MQHFWDILYTYVCHREKANLVMSLKIETRVQMETLMLQEDLQSIPIVGQSFTDAKLIQHDAPKCIVTSNAVPKVSSARSYFRYFALLHVLSPSFLFIYPLLVLLIPSNSSKVFTFTRYPRNLTLNSTRITHLRVIRSVDI